MKLASIKTTAKNYTYDGQLCVQSPQHSRHLLKIPHEIIPCMRVLLESWPQNLAVLKKYLQEHQDIAHYTPIDQVEIIAPLPRTFGWLDGSAFIQHVKLVRKARNAPLPETLTTVPLMYQGGSDSFLAYNQTIPMIHPNWGLDFEGEIGVITTFVPQGTKAHEAHQYIALLVMINDITLRELIPAELAQGFGFLQSKPSSTLSPFVITLDEVENSFKDGRLHLPFITKLNGKIFGNPNMQDMHFSFYQLIEHATKTRSLAAGTIIGSGTISNEDRSKGSCCIVEQRMLEIIDTGSPKSPYLKTNDRVEMEIFNEKNQSLFGAIHQVVSPCK